MKYETPKYLQSCASIVVKGEVMDRVTKSRVTMRLDEGRMLELRLLTRKRGLSVSAIVREALRQHIEAKFQIKDISGETKAELDEHFR